MITLMFVPVMYICQFLKRNSPFKMLFTLFFFLHISKKNSFFCKYINIIVTQDYNTMTWYENLYYRTV